MRKQSLFLVFTFLSVLSNFWKTAIHCSHYFRLIKAHVKNFSSASFLNVFFKKSLLSIDRITISSFILYIIFWRTDLA